MWDIDVKAFTVLADAIEQVEAVNRSDLYKIGGQPELPRCDHPQYGGGQFKGKPGGRKPVHPCLNRNQPRLGCPCVTLTHSIAYQVGLVYLVPVDAAHASLDGVTITGGGPPVIIDALPTRKLTVAEALAFDQETATIAWGGETLSP